MRDLLPKDFGSTMEAIDACRGAYDWLPTFHQFKQAYEGVCRRKDAHAQSMVALGPAPPAETDEDAEWAKDHIAGRGKPRDVVASLAYNRVWRAHVGDPARIGRKVK